MPRSIHLPLNAAKISALAPKNYPHAALKGVSFTPEKNGKTRAVATDGRIGIIIEYPRDNTDIDPIIIPAELFKEARKTSSVTAELIFNKEHDLSIGVKSTNKDNGTNNSQGEVIVGRYPDLAAVIPKPKESDMVVAINASLMLKLMKVLEQIVEHDYTGGAYVMMRISSPNHPIVFSRDSPELSEQVTAILMPLQIRDLDKQKEN